MTTRTQQFQNAHSRSLIVTPEIFLGCFMYRLFALKINYTASNTFDSMIEMKYNLWAMYIVQDEQSEYEHNQLLNTINRLH